ncbi:MAG: potassium-transporting ATPase subunit KdpC [Dehalococcoidia bacterium]|nr:potassium-transporting ATPase subunit KdpC [Dehalococcoidia bacterium]MDD5495182.1 potassium-transporting ATPase subunit KdpC [Dehalococcoidia bacterium]
MSDKSSILHQLRIALKCLVVLTLITGIIYPLIVTGIAQIVFKYQANGSLIAENGKRFGSELIGQPFSDPKYFWGRLSATTPYPYNASASSGSNYGPLNPELDEEVRARIKVLKTVDPDNMKPIPVDLVTHSASGLDPHISIAAATYQVHRVAFVRGLSEEIVNALVTRYTEGRQFGFLGEPRVNVLKLNLALDQLPGQTGSSKM